MRHYPRNSPEAAARLLALALLADGHLSRSELLALERLGLSPTAWHGVVHALCEDLLASAHLTWSDRCRVEWHTLRALVADVTEPALRHKVLALAVAAIESDGQICDDESQVLAAMFDAWGLDAEALTRALALPLPATSHPPHLHSF
jgi:tellurite resistance protein